MPKPRGLIHPPRNRLCTCRPRVLSGTWRRRVPSAKERIPPPLPCGRSRRIAALGVARLRALLGRAPASGCQSEICGRIAYQGRTPLRGQTTPCRRSTLRGETISSARRSTCGRSALGGGAIPCGQTILCARTTPTPCRRSLRGGTTPRGRSTLSQHRRGRTRICHRRRGGACSVLSGSIGCAPAPKGEQASRPRWDGGRRRGRRRGRRGGRRGGRRRGGRRWMGRGVVGGVRGVRNIAFRAIRMFSSQAGWYGA